MPGKTSASNLVPDFRVLVNGSNLPPEAAADLITLTVDEDIESPSMFALRLVNWDMRKLQVTWSDADLFAEGTELEIQMGYVDNLQTLIAGEITGLEPEFCSADIPTLVVRGYDRRHRLMRGCKTRSFKQMKDSDLASQIASAAGLSPKVQDSKVVLDYVLQHNQTDLEFLQQRARQIGYEVVVEKKLLYFQPQQHTKKETLTLSLDKNLLEFHPRSSMLTQVDQVEVRAWNPKEKKAISAKAASGQESTKMGGSASGPQASKKAFGQSSNISVEHQVFTQAEADQIALGCFNDMALAYLSGDGLCLGQADLRAGVVVKVDGLGKRFSGLYYVTAATHSYTPEQGYTTAFSVRRNAT